MATKKRKTKKNTERGLTGMSSSQARGIFRAFFKAKDDYEEAKAKGPKDRSKVPTKEMRAAATAYRNAMKQAEAVKQAAEALKEANAKRKAEKVVEDGHYEDFYGTYGYGRDKSRGKKKSSAKKRSTRKTGRKLSRYNKFMKHFKNQWKGGGSFLKAAARKWKSMSEAQKSKYGKKTARDAAIESYYGRHY